MVLAQVQTPLAQDDALSRILAGVLGNSWALAVIGGVFALYAIGIVEEKRQKKAGADTSNPFTDPEDMELWKHLKAQRLAEIKAEERRKEEELESLKARVEQLQAVIRAYEEGEQGRVGF